VTTRIHKLPVESEIGRLTVRKALSKNLWEESKWINWKGRIISCVHVNINDTSYEPATQNGLLIDSPMCLS
jgi:hypothetical protein